MKIGNLEVYGIIYKITNKVNGKVYIGQTINGFDIRYPYKGEDIERVYSYYLSLKNQNTIHNEHLINSIEKYGLKSFKINKTFDVAFSKEELDIKEKFWIFYYDSFKNGYNKTTGGNKSTDMSEESKNKMSEIKKIIYLGENNPNSKKVICLNTMKIFNTAQEGAKYYDRAKTSLTQHLKGRSTSCGILNNTPLVWEYYDKYLLMSEYEICSKINNAKQINGGKNVICITTNKKFKTALEGSEYYNVDSSGIIKCCKGKVKYNGKLEDGTKLIWRYCNY